MKSWPNYKLLLVLWSIISLLSACTGPAQPQPTTQVPSWIYIALGLLALIVGRIMASWKGHGYTQSIVGLVVIGIVVGIGMLGYRLSLQQAVLLSVSYLIGYLSKHVSRHMARGLDEYEQAQAILGPLRQRYYKPDYQPSLQDQDAINNQRDQLEQAISLLNTARVSRLRAGEIGRRDAIVALHEIGLAHRLLGNFAQAKSDFQKAYAEMQQLYSEYQRDDHHRPRLAQSLGAYCLDIGEVEYFSGNLTTAAEWYKRAITFSEEAGDKEYVQIAKRLLARVHK